MGRRGTVLFASLAATSLGAALLFGACGGRVTPPPRPDRTIVPSMMGVAAAVTYGPCGMTEVHLETGDVVNVHDPTAFSTDCPASPSYALTMQRFGDRLDLSKMPQGEGAQTTNGHAWAEGHGPLVFSGPEDSGWIATARWNGPGSGYEGAWCFFLDEADAAYVEGTTLVVNGLVIVRASTFEVRHGSEAYDFPLRSSDTLCFNADGEATLASIWGSY